MADIELILRAGRAEVAGNVFLVLGGNSTAPQVIFDGVASGRYGLRGAVAGTYDNAVSRGVSQTLTMPFDQAQPLNVDLATRWRPSQFNPVDKRAVWKAARAQGVDVRVRWQSSAAKPVQTAVSWGDGQAVQAQTAMQWQKTKATVVETRAWWDVALPVDAVAALAFDYAKFTPLTTALRWDNVAKPVNATLAMPFDDKAKAQHLTRIAPWNNAKAVSSYGGAWSYVVPQNPPPYVQPRDTNLVLCCLQPRFPFNAVALLLGGDPCVLPTETTEILPARVYMTVHNVFAQRLPDLASVPIYDATLSADEGSFAWSFTANGPESLFASLARTSTLPTSIKITLDGLEWVFLVENIRRTYAFGKTGAAISGRSVTALAGDPWTREAAYNNATDQNAQQLAAAALDLSGVGLDWGITDWLVGAGAWSHSGSRLSAVQRIAESAGGYVQSHRSAATLQVRHPYPLLTGGVPGGPWNWAAATPDVVLAGDVVITANKEVKDGPDIDGVYISGTNQGVIAFVKRTGTAGAKLAAMQTDSLLTHLDANTQRGLSVLGKAGSKEFVTLELPVLTGASQPGVIDVGKLVQVNESTPWRGRVRSVSVNYSRPALRQSITVERHL